MPPVCRASPLLSLCLDDPKRYRTQSHYDYQKRYKRKSKPNHVPIHQGSPKSATKKTSGPKAHHWGVLPRAARRPRRREEDRVRPLAFEPDDGLVIARHTVCDFVPRAWVVARRASPHRRYPRLSAAHLSPKGGPVLGSLLDPSASK
jgi:hypothetical protein